MCGDTLGYSQTIVRDAKCGGNRAPALTDQEKCSRIRDAPQDPLINLSAAFGDRFQVNVKPFRGRIGTDDHVLRRCRRLHGGYHCHGRVARCIAARGQRFRESFGPRQVECVKVARRRVPGAIASFDLIERRFNVVTIKINRRHRIGALRSAAGRAPEPAVDQRGLGCRPRPNVEPFEPPRGFVTEVHGIASARGCRRFVADDMLTIPGGRQAGAKSRDHEASQAFRIFGSLCYIVPAPLRHARWPSRSSRRRPLCLIEASVKQAEGPESLKIAGPGSDRRAVG